MYSQSKAETLQNVRLQNVYGIFKTVSCSNNGHQTIVINLRFKNQTFPLPALVCNQKDTHLEIL